MDLRHRGSRGTLRPASAGGNGRQGQLVRVHPADHFRILTHRARPEPANLRGEHRLLHRPRRAARTHPGAEPVPGPAPAPGLRPAAAGPASRGRRHRPALHLRPPGTPGQKPGTGRNPNRLLHHRGHPRPDLRCPAVPGGQSRRRPAHRRAQVRGGRRDPRGTPGHRAAPGDHPAGAPRAGLRRRAVLRPQPGRIRCHPDLRRQPAGRHPHPAAGDLFAARNRRRRRRLALPPPGRRGGGRRRALLPAPAPRRCTGRGIPVTFQLDATLAARGFEVSLSLGPAETIAILGPNGAGKSTLLSIISGLLRPDAGKATIGEKVLFDLSADTNIWRAPHTRGTALLAQEALLFPHLSALDNVAFGPRSAGASSAAARETAMHWLSEVDADSLASRRPGQLSGGQAQRVAVARALAADPDLLLLDEPMAALDIHAAPLLRRLLKRVLAGRRAIIITHDILDALMLADRVIVLEDGRITEQGPTREVLEKPRSRFAAGLAGLNLVAGTVSDAGVTTAQDMVVAGHQDESVEPGQDGVAVFPPSAVSVFLTEEHGSPRNSFRVIITDLEPHGDQIRVRAGRLSADITPAASADLGLVPGMSVYFVIKAAALAIYPA